MTLLDEIRYESNIKIDDKIDKSGLFVKGNSGKWKLKWEMSDIEMWVNTNDLFFN